MKLENHLFTSQVITLKKTNSINDALNLMYKKEIKRIIIVEGKKPIGIITERDIGNFIEKDKTSRTLDKITIDQIMTKNLITIHSGQEDHLIQCAIRMEAFQVCAILVIDKNGNLVGITTKSDLTMNFANLYYGIFKIKDYMTKKLFTCRKSDSLLFVLKMLNKNQITRLIVTDNLGKPFGIVSYDLFFKHTDYFKENKPSKTRDYLIPDESKQNMQIGELIENKLITVNSNEDLAAAAKLMSMYKISGLPTTDEMGNLDGVITSTDVTRAYSEIQSHKNTVKNDPHFS